MAGIKRGMGKEKRKVKLWVKTVTRCVFKSKTDRASKKRRQVSTKNRASINLLESKDKRRYRTNFCYVTFQKRTIGAYGHFSEWNG